MFIDYYNNKIFIILILIIKSRDANFTLFEYNLKIIENKNYILLYDIY